MRSSARLAPLLLSLTISIPKQRYGYMMNVISIARRFLPGLFSLSPTSELFLELMKVVWKTKLTVFFTHLRPIK